MEAFDGARVLVTGAAGFIGSHLCERLVAEGCHVTGIDNFDPFYDPAIKRRNVAALQQHPRFRLVEGDIRDLETLRALFADTPFTQVVHLAARAGVRPSIAEPLAYASVNVHGTLTILEAMREAGCRELVFASSSSVYGERETVPFRETDPVERPISPYAATKRACELMIATWHHLHGIAANCLRFFTVYGPRQRPDLAIAKFAARMLAGETIEIYGDGSAERDFTYIDDIIDGVVRAMQRLEGYEIYNLGEQHTTSVLELVRLLERALGCEAKLRFTDAQPGDVSRTFADVQRARERLGYRPSTPIERGIERYVAWLREQPAAAASG
ncbi:MAG: NAD-dependent epimerase/dehydratase family protein [Planctomycetota bacterium]|nr:MAG: NAD-dependent epimerase/dehydratase family protein [Planctomycetota bacterium]